MAIPKETKSEEDSGKLELLKEGKNFRAIGLSNLEKDPDCITNNDIKHISYENYLGFEIIKCFESGLEKIRIWNIEDPERFLLLWFTDLNCRKRMTIQQLGYVDKACFLDLKRATEDRQKRKEVTWFHEQIGFDSNQGKQVFKYYNILNAPFQSIYAGANFSHRSRVCGIKQTS